jgi:hypothetical protein
MSAQSRRFVPRLEVLADRSLPSVTAAIVPGTTILQITGDEFDNAVTISDGGDQGVITVAGGELPQSFDAALVDSILVQTFDGDDTVTYNLTGPLSTTRLVTVDLGRGYDTFTANLDNQTISGAGTNLGISVEGGRGGDTMVLNAAGVTVAPGARLSVDFHGEAGKDFITFNHSWGLAIPANVTLTKDQKH